MHFYLRKAALYRDMLVGRLVCPTRVLVFSKRDKTVLYVYTNSYNVTMLQCYNITMLQCYYNVTMLQRYNII